MCMYLSRVSLLLPHSPLPRQKFGVRTCISPSSLESFQFITQSTSYWASDLAIRQPLFILVPWSLPHIILFWDNCKPCLSFEDSYERVWPQPWPKLWTFSIPQDWKPTTFQFLDLPPSSCINGKEKNILSCGRLKESWSLYSYSTSFCSTWRRKQIPATKTYGFLISNEGRCPNFQQWHLQCVLFTVTGLLKWVTFPFKYPAVSTQTQEWEIKNIWLMIMLLFSCTGV
jgi:hypothetical protein